MFIHEHIQKNDYSLYKWRGSSLSKQLNIQLPKKYISTNISLDNYDGLANSREHLLNMHMCLELVIEDSDLICEIFHATFRGSAHAWYNNLDPNTHQENLYGAI